MSVKRHPLLRCYILDVRRHDLFLLAAGLLLGCPPSSSPQAPAHSASGSGKAPAKGPSAPPSAATTKNGSPKTADAPTPASAPPRAGIGSRIPGDPPRRVADRAAVQAAIAQLSDLVRKGATDPTNPWAMAHGLLAFGPDLKASDGRLVTEAIIADFMKTRSVGGRTVGAFAERTATNAPLEPHPFMVTKAFAEAGVPLNRSMTFAGGQTSLRKLLDDAAFQFEVPQDNRGWQNVAWALSALATHPAKDQQIQTQSGPISLETAAQAAVARLEQAQTFLVKPMQLGRPDVVQKRKQGIYAHTCGGLHFVQAAVRSGGHFPQLHARLRKQLDLVRFRWAAERRIYRQLMDLRPRYRNLLLVQELKFYGHLLETMALAVKWKLLAPDQALKLEMRQVAGDLLDTIRALEPHYAVQDAVRDATPQLYYDLIGDGCHAIRGLRESLVAFF